MNYKHNSKLTVLAKNLRKNGTKEENSLWYLFLKKLNIRFLRQKIVDNYIIDFYCPKLKLGIELDGSQHFEADGLLKDKIRTEHLEKRDITIIRIPNNEINNNFNGVCEYLNNFLVMRSQKRPLLKGRGPRSGEGIQ